MATGRRTETRARTQCPSCGRRVGAKHRFCPGCGAPVSSDAVAQGSPPSWVVAPPPGSTPPGSTPPGSTPAGSPAVAETLAPVRSGPSLQVGQQPAEALEEQRKVVTVMFADISGSTPLAERLDPEEMRAILGRYFSVLAHQIQSFGGTIDKYIGDAVMSVFGAPVSREDDALRAVGAALAMLDALARENDELERRHGVRLSLRIGINTGEVVAGLLAGNVQAAYTVVGDTVNTAQRLESVAPANTILVGESTYLPGRRAFRFEAIAPVTLKGKSEPVPAFRVIGPERRAAPREGTKLVGRTAELGRLYELLRRASAGTGQILHLHADAGVGKSRLVNEFLVTLPSVARLRARCLAFESAKPYALIADLLRRTFQVQPTDQEAAAHESLAAGIRNMGLQAEEGSVALCLEILGYGDRSPLDPQRKRQLLVSLLRQLLKHRASIEPVVLVVEDVHWADAASSSVLAEVVADVPRLRCLVVATSRERVSILPGAAAVAIEPLPPEAAATMLAQLGGEKLEPGVRALVLERTAGNPFFIEEVVRTLRSGASASVPATVQDVLEARLDALQPAVRHVAQRAAVIGRTFRQRVLGAISPGESMPAALGTLEAEAFVVRVGNGTEPRYAFRHALLQEVSYQTLLLAQRRALHGAVGDAFERLYPDRLDEFVDVLAYHYARSEVDAKARGYLLRAGERAQRLYARDEALAYFRQAIERSAEHPATRSAAHEGIADVERLGGRYAAALEAYDHALLARQEDEAVDRARLLRKKGVITLHSGDQARALALFEEALGVIPREAGGERARALLEIGEVRWRRGEYDAALESLGQAVADAERARDDAARAEALKHLGTVHVMRGDKTQSLRCYEHSLELYTRVGDPAGQANVLNNMALVLQRAGRNDEALAAHERSLALRERIGDQVGIATSRNNAAEIYRARGDLDRAEEGYRAALEMWTAIGYTGVAVAHSNLGLTAIEKGEPVEARRHLTVAMEEHSRSGNRSYLLDTKRHLARSYLLDDPRQAVAAAEEALGSARELDAPDKQGMALQVLGLAHEALGDIPSAIAELEQSRAMLVATAEQQELARTLGALGRLYRKLPPDDPRRAQAAPLHEEARRILTELGAALELRRLETAAT